MTKTLPNFWVNFLARFASKHLFYWVVPSNCSENSLVLFVPVFSFGVLFGSLIEHRAIRNRWAAIWIGDSESIFRDFTLLQFHSFSCFSLRKFWRLVAYDSGNRAVRKSRFCAAKVGQSFLFISSFCSLSALGYSSSLGWRHGIERPFLR